MKRSDAIRLLAEYFNMSHELAQGKYSELKLLGNNILEETLDKAKAGGRADPPGHCPLCHAELMQRVHTRGRGRFWGCKNYPTCRYKRAIEVSLSAAEKLELAKEFLKAVGGLDEAAYWLKLAMEQKI